MPDEKNVLLDVIDRFVNDVIEEGERQKNETEIGIADYLMALKLTQTKWHREASGE